MPVTVTLTFSVKPEMAPEFISLLESLLPDTRAYDGCLRVDVYQDQDSPGRILLVEDWESKQHQQRYQSWRDESGIAEVVGPFLAGEPSFSYFDKLGV
ncbi:MAG: antibiotic biosynthesis monooxygenase [SAR202 cluster bacterium]|nr:antibiotic biosynthesis monooxygenase [Chloroflexota bacterium]MQG35067.1 antibiotic biosynthesis monooxygenase [SAR202 cluster bacterium]HCL26561.1 antibiotic biosynthesis monooxygenase [Dehalococcoidia bacterium]HCP23403.1 antibiotic biosynthesis monooxygenase [Dehalococcoidia bacterium]|tara:strand:+ start:276 stop:569 length:294 start_codon:yes stop_codon:yes gene_type:complete